MHNRQPTPGQEGRVLITPEDGSPAFYARISMADNPLHPGTPISKETLLQDDTAAMLGLGVDATPDDFLSALCSMAAAKVNCEVGSYVGTGTYGSANPNTLTFGFAPKMVVVVANSSSGIVPGSVFIAGQTESDGIGNYDNPSYALELQLTWEDHSVSWYTTSDEAGNQLNYNGTIYHYIALGA